MAKNNLYPLGRRIHDLLYYAIGYAILLFWVFITFAVFVGYLLFHVWMDLSEPLRTANSIIGMAILIGGLPLSWWYAWGVTPSLIYKVEQFWSKSRAGIGRNDRT